MRQPISDTSFFTATKKVRVKLVRRTTIASELQTANFELFCGEETSPTPQMDWFLAHGLKVAFDLILRRTRQGKPPLISAF
jgi:hypothetical protein